MNISLRFKVRLRNDVREKTLQNSLKRGISIVKAKAQLQPTFGLTYPCLYPARRTRIRHVTKCRIFGFTRHFPLLNNMFAFYPAPSVEIRHNLAHNGVPDFGENRLNCL